MEDHVATAIAGAGGGMIGGGFASVQRGLDRKMSVASVLIATALGSAAPSVVSRFVHISVFEGMGIGTLTGMLILSIAAVIHKFGVNLEKDPRKAIGDVVAGNIPTSPDSPTGDK